MYHRALNGIFNLFAKWEGHNACKSAEKLVSNHGITKNLQERLRHNENFRYQIFKGKFNEEFTQDKLKAAEQKIEASYKSGLIDSGKYQTQLYKIKSLRNMRFAETYSRWTLDKDNLKYYKLKYATQLGEDVDRLAFNYHRQEEISKKGLLYGAVNKSE